MESFKKNIKKGARKITESMKGMGHRFIEDFKVLSDSDKATYSYIKIFNIDITNHLNLRDENFEKWKQEVIRILERIGFDEVKSAPEISNSEKIIFEISFTAIKNARYDSIRKYWEEDDLYWLDEPREEVVETKMIRIEIMVSFMIDYKDQYITVRALFNFKEPEILQNNTEMIPAFVDAIKQIVYLLKPLLSYDLGEG